MDKGRKRPTGSNKTSQFRQDEYDDGEIYEDYDEDYEEYERRPRRRRRSYEPPHRRRVWPFVLGGCALGVFCTVLAAAITVFLAIRSAQGIPLKSLPGFGGPETFTQDTTQALAISGSIEQMQICNKIGNVAITVDPAAKTAMLTTKKTVQATTKAEADQEFKRITVDTRPSGASNPAGCTQQNTANVPATPPTGTASNTLTIMVSVPENTDVTRSGNDSVDVSIVLPSSILPTDTPTMLLDVEAAVGNVTVNGLGGVFNIRVSTGDVTLNNALLLAGSQIEAGQGRIAFSGSLVIPPQAVVDPKNPPRFVLLSERGNIDVTLPSTTLVTLDANTNAGTITSEFAINLQNNGGPVNYHGPLVASADVSPAILVLHVSTGNIAIHKAKE